MARRFDFDVLIIGSGAAGLTLALHLPESTKIGVLSKASLDAGSSNYAQGGVAAVLAASDSIESHVNDTLAAGGGLCDPAAVQFTVEHSAQAIAWLIDLGVPFTTKNSSNNDAAFHLTQEGGHSKRRVIHVADATGRAIESTLIQHLADKPNVTGLENRIAIDLITEPAGKDNRARCIGAYVYDLVREKVDIFRAKTVVLATGGASKVYLYTSNPDGSTGDGIAIAWRAGCRVANMEFNQFHPTCFYHPQAKSFLITEAVRGEGGKIKLPNGDTFLERFDPRAELAPRDIVARAIDYEMKRLGLDCVYLDISDKPADFIKEHFPTVYQKGLELGYDMTKEPLPVVPAAHYTCGGVITDLHGRTDLDNLYAIGEAAHTGLHGANRMASNSLLECFVFAIAASADITARGTTLTASPDIPDWDESQVRDSDEEVVVTHNWHELRRFMWDYVGIVRTTKRLQRAKRRIDMLQAEIAEYYGNFRVTNDLLELRNLVAVANLIVRSALERQESRGLHHILDFPEPNDEMFLHSTILVPENAVFEMRETGALAFRRQ